jgi:hypothetical protein
MHGGRPRQGDSAEVLWNASDSGEAARAGRSGDGRRPPHSPPAPRVVAWRADPPRRVRAELCPPRATSRGMHAGRARCMQGMPSESDLPWNACGQGWMHARQGWMHARPGRPGWMHARPGAARARCMHARVHRRRGRAWQGGAAICSWRSSHQSLPLTWTTISDAIRRNQTQSDAIRRNQTQSDRSPGPQAAGLG